MGDRRENLHRADLTVRERSEHVAEWIRLSDHAVQPAPYRKAGQQPDGINAAWRDLGIEQRPALMHDGCSATPRPRAITPVAEFAGLPHLSGAPENDDPAV